MEVLEKGSVCLLARTHGLSSSLCLPEIKMVEVDLGVVVEMEVEVEEPELASRRIA